MNCLKDRVFINSSQWCKGQRGYTILIYFVNFHDLVPSNCKQFANTAYSAEYPIKTTHYEQ